MHIIIIILLIVATIFSKSIELQMADSMLLEELYDSELFQFTDNYFQAEDSVDQIYNFYAKSQISTPLDTSRAGVVRRRIRTAAGNNTFSGRISFTDNNQNRLLVSEWSAFSNFGSKKLSLTCGTFKQSLGLGLLIGGAKRTVSRIESDTLSLKGSLFNTLGSQSNGVLFKYKGKFTTSLSYSWNEKTFTSSIGIPLKNIYNQLMFSNEGAAVYLSTTSIRRFKTHLEYAISKGGVASAIIQEFLTKNASAKLTAWSMSDSFPTAGSRGPTLYQGWRLVHTDNSDTIDVRRPGESGFKIATSLDLPLLKLKIESGMSTIPLLSRKRKILKLNQRFEYSRIVIDAAERFRADNSLYDNYLTSSLDLNLQLTQNQRWSYKASYGTLLYSNRETKVHQSHALAVFTHNSLKIGGGPSLHVSNTQSCHGIQIYESVTFSNSGALKIVYNSVPTTELRAYIEWNM